MELLSDPIADQSGLARQLFRFLVAEDRSAGDVRARTGPEPPWSVLGPQPPGKRPTTVGTSGHRPFIETAGRCTTTL
jgi:hypothetical protein